MARRSLLRRRGGPRTHRIALPPPLVLAALYAAFILLGTFALKLPIAHHVPITWSDSLFTAASAVTVTGLVVFDPGSVLTPFGEAVILVLIQLGGLGLMTFAVLVLSALGLPVGLGQQILLREDLNQTSLRNLLLLVRDILRVVLAFELAGAALLALVFVPDLGWAEGLWSAVFHAVSAFNNAGISLHAYGLVPWVGDPLLNLVVPALFIFGGLGYSVVSDLWRRRGWTGLTLHSKLMLTGTAALILFSFAAVAALEWTNPHTLGALGGPGEKLLASWFQAVTPRTAGFNTVDVGGLRDSTSLLVMCLMMIGGGSTSTAGGVKVTTVVVLLIATVAFFRRRTTLGAFHRSIPLEEVLKVMAIATVSVFVVVLGIFLLTIGRDHAEFLDIAFEVTSAFGTVGLSRGLTPELGEFGRAVIVAEMFLGRVGPLTLGFFLATRATPRVRYPSARVQFG